MTCPFCMEDDNNGDDLVPIKIPQGCKIIADGCSRYHVSRTGRTLGKKRPKVTAVVDDDQIESLSISPSNTCWKFDRVKLLCLEWYEDWGLTLW